MTTPIEPNPQRWTPSVDPASIVVPGLDTSASINDQVDQIEQLITIKLQNIDANFSKIQHLMSTRLLPAVKRYAVGTESVREAAKFWTSFYEQAAQVHIPTLDDYDGMHDVVEQTPEAVSGLASVSYPGDASDMTPSRMQSGSTTKTYDVTASESSFMPANAVSSTPARPGHAPDQTTLDDPSWSASLDLPMVRLKTELQSFAREEEEETSSREDTSLFTDSIMYEEENTVQQLPSSGQVKTERSASQADRDHSNHSSHLPRSALPTPRPKVTNVSPLKLKPKTPIAIPKHIQPFLPSKLENEPAFQSPRRPRFERTPRKPALPSSSASTSASASSSTLDIPSLTKHVPDSKPEPKFTAFNDSFDDSVDLMQGMSPPRTLAFARAPRSSIGLGLLPPLGRTPGKAMLPSLGRTPGKEAADRIRRDLLGDMQSQFGSANSAASNKMRTPAFGYSGAATKDDTMSTIPTPPSLSKYTRHAYPSWTDNDTDTSLATMMRRLGLEMPESSSHADSTVSDSHSRTSSQANVGGSEPLPPMRGDELHTPEHQGLDMFDLHHDDQSAIHLGSHPHPDEDSDSDSDSLDDEPVGSSQPSTAFLMAASREPDPDDSFGSSNHSSDSLGVDDFEGGDEVAVHPFARALVAGAGDGDGFDDSFDSEGGYDGGQGEDASQVTEETVFGIPSAQHRQQGREPGQLRILGEDLLQDTIGIGGQLAKAGRIEESPTPYGRG
ncbi:hypothetical protein JVU11DRAFT_4688 [Chiua virens]|nr:hypothetical protein JVU11DRAFT_4688 [Chiua virens]